MLAKTSIPVTVQREPEQLAASHPVTPLSLTLLMAYIHNYTPKRVHDARLFGPNDLRQLAKLIGFPDKHIRSIRQHKPLACHLALLQAAGFLHDSGPCLTLQPIVTNWLHASNHNQIDMLIQLLDDDKNWSCALSAMKLQKTIPLDYTKYLRQSLLRQKAALPIIKAADSATWQDTTGPEVWQLAIPAHLPLWLHFDLRQLGNWAAKETLVMTPFTIATAVNRGYGLELIQWLLETATQKPLPTTTSCQLRQWSRRAGAVQLRTVHLLSTAQADQMAQMLRHKRLRGAIVEQLSSRHALVRYEAISQFKEHLAQQGFPIALPPALPEPAAETNAATAWLAICILIKLGQLVPLPCPSPHNLLAQLATELEAHQKSELEAIASGFVQNIREAIQGRDAFLPAGQAPTPWLIQQIENAIRTQTMLTIHYRALAAPEPRQHDIEPHHLEKRGQLYYLHAYSCRAEATLTFRLDRIEQLEQADG